jgi:uncharacterized protein YggT (Ycf19 family)
MRQVAKLTACLALLLSAASWAIVPPEPGPNSLTNQAFFKPEMYLPITNIPLTEVQSKMSALNAGAWDDFFARNGKSFNVYVDSRTGAATSIEGSIPLIPGSGVGNKVTLESLRTQLGRNVAGVDKAVIADLLLRVFGWIIIAHVILSLLIAFNVINMQSGFVRSLSEGLDRLTAPIYRPIRRILPDFGGLDFSPLVVLLAIQIIRMLLQGLAMEVAV